MRQPGTIIIIGASSGLGRCTAELFCQKGWKVGAAARREDKLLELKALYPENIHTEILDVNDDSTPGNLMRFIKRLGGADIIFLSAGIGWANPSLELEKDIATVQTNVMGFIRIINTAYNYFKNENPNGQIAAISSVAGTKGIGVSASYSASKSFNSTYLEALAQLARIDETKITVTDIRPGFVRTDLLAPDRKYPMLMTPESAAGSITDAILKRKNACVINRKWAFVVFLWRLVPRRLWTKLKIKF